MTTTADPPGCYLDESCGPGTGARPVPVRGRGPAHSTGSTRTSPRVATFPKLIEAKPLTSTSTPTQRRQRTRDGSTPTTPLLSVEDANGVELP